MKSIEYYREKVKGNPMLDIRELQECSTMEEFINTPYHKSSDMTWWLWRYASTIMMSRWEEVEPLIIKNGEIAAWYAVTVIKGLWPEAEPIIIQEAWSAYRYAEGVFKGRWIEAEPMIMQNARVAFLYTKQVVK